MDALKVMIGRKRFTFTMSVRRFHDLKLAVQAIGAAGRDFDRAFFARGDLIDALAAMSDRPRRARFALEAMLPGQVEDLAERLIFGLMGRDDEAGKKDEALAGRRRGFTRAQLETPVWRVAVLTGERIDDLLDLPLAEFNRRQASVEAAVAGIKLELLRLLDFPQMKKGDRMELVRDLEHEIKSTWGPSPWEEDFARARELIMH